MANTSALNIPDSNMLMSVRTGQDMKTSQSNGDYDEEEPEESEDRK
jgi:hypothetical protein